jgi:ribulose-phosphate 3-epimerase
MSNAAEIIPTVVPESLEGIEAAIRTYSGFARTLHIDFADGVFAPNSTWLPAEAFSVPGMQWEAHLMVSEPGDLGHVCIESGASRVIGHVEAMRDHQKTLAAWKVSGVEVGLALLAQTQSKAFAPHAALCDFAMLMTIKQIGVQGLPFDTEAPSRVAAFHAQYPTLPVEVDGSVNETTIGSLARAGATRFCAGSVLSKSPDSASTYRNLLALASGVE